MKDFERLEQRLRARRSELERLLEENRAAFARLRDADGIRARPLSLAWQITGKAVALVMMAIAASAALAVSVSIRPPPWLRAPVALVQHSLPIAASCPPPAPIIGPDPSPLAHDSWHEPPRWHEPLPDPPPVAPVIVRGDGGAPFDRGAAAGALGSINLATCRSASGPTGSGHVRVTFEPIGKVSRAEVDMPPFAGTSTGDCIAKTFRATTIPKFTGQPVTVGKSFSLF